LTGTAARFQGFDLLRWVEALLEAIGAEVADVSLGPALVPSPAKHR